jgi:outer membrane protein OmpA-like peptidoglycan-associated protein
VHEVLRSSGQPLEAGVRADMESRLGHDFSRVRVHADERAAASARGVDALAYTVGRDVVFDSARYAPHTIEGRQLLAHELAHVVQQDEATGGDLRVAPPDSPHEREADDAAARAAAGIRAPSLSHAPAQIRRKLAIKDPGRKPPAAPAKSIETNESVVRGYIANLCPDFSVLSGRVSPSTDRFCPFQAAALTSYRHGCTCLCSLHGLDETWTIVIDDANWPRTAVEERTVHVFSPYGGIETGSWSEGELAPRGTIGAHRVETPNWLVLGHELCGHALLHAIGVHPEQGEAKHGGLPSHDVTVEIENRLRAEHGMPATQRRGLFADPHHGGSFGRVTVYGFEAGSADPSTLALDQRSILDRAARFIVRAETFRGTGALVDVVGHSDPDEAGGVDQLRANAIRDELVRRGVKPAQLRAVNGAGAEECIAAGVNPFCRKVDIFIFAFEGVSLEHTEPEPGGPGPGDYPIPPEGTRVA